MLKTVFIFLTLISISLCAEDKESIKSYKFTVPEYNDKGKLNFVVNGDQGTITGKEANITGVFVQIFHKESPLNLTTSSCKYFLDKKRCTGNEFVQIKGDGINITGKGFDIDNNEKKIFIRNEVKVVWKKAKAPDKLNEKKENK